MENRPDRKTHNMLIGRVSIPGARYFITTCSKDRRNGLTDPQIAKSIVNAWRSMHTDDDFVLHCATIMPDHTHFLITLGKRLTLSKMIVKFKTLTTKALASESLEWQRNFYDHRLRYETELEGFSKYIFMNPYKNRIIEVSTSYPHWYLNKKYTPEFVLNLTARKYPPPEWLGEAGELLHSLLNKSNDQNQ